MLSEAPFYTRPQPAVKPSQPTIRRTAEPSLVYKQRRQDILDGHPPRPLQHLSSADNTFLDAWCVWIEEAMGEIIDLGQRVYDCGQQCRDDCPSDGFHGPAASKHDRVVSLLSDLRAAIERSGKQLS